MMFHGDHLITRSAYAVQAAVLCGALMGGGSLGAQNAPTSPPPASRDTAGQPYTVRRAEVLKDIKASQRKLDELRVQRLQLESRVEAVASKAAEQRANTLMMSRETYALRQLDSLLTTSQDNLLAQRDRFLSLGEAVRRRAGAELVVVFRADSSTQMQRIDSVTVEIDDGVGAQRHYSIIASGALGNGAIDELYRSNVLPASHAVALTVSANGAPQKQTVHVDAAAGAITYVQFTLRNGQMTQATWANRDTAPR
jgi:hypothetical protein